MIIAALLVVVFNAEELLLVIAGVMNSVQTLATYRTLEAVGMVEGA